LDSPPRTGATRTSRRSKMLPARIGAGPSVRLGAEEESRLDVGGLVANWGAKYGAPTKEGSPTRVQFATEKLASFWAGTKFGLGEAISSGICGLWELPTT